jgi:hypothetical protein
MDILDKGVFGNIRQKMAIWLKKSNKYIHQNWDEFKEISKREKRETIIAIEILHDMIVGMEVTDAEKRFLKHQIKDIIKILFLISLKVIPSPIPFTPIAIWIGKKLGISILPTSQPQLPYRN